MEKAATEVLKQRWDRTRKVEFYARYREPAVALLAAHAVLGDDRATDEAAGRLLEGMDRHGKWSSTSDTGWSLYALSHYLGRSAPPDGPVTVTVTAGSAQPQTFTLQAGVYHRIDIDSTDIIDHPELSLSADTTFPILYKLSLGFPRIDYHEKGHSEGISVYKEIRNTDGADRIRVGDLVKVDVYLEADDYGYRHVILDDPLPAGLVAINTALKSEEPVPGRQGADYEDYWDHYYRSEEGHTRFAPNFFEMRDERVLAYREYLWKGTFQFTYYARAVCEGEFVIPPTKAELMYSPQINGYSSAATLIIEGRP